MNASSPWNPVDVTIASAGTGKTTALIDLLSRAIEEGTAPERILAATFSRRAAGELIERARSCLIEKGMIDKATRLLNARLGTINAVCGRLVSEFAFELGRSPSCDVIAEEDVSSVFALAADDTIAQFAPRLNELADQFGLADQDIDWRDQVRCIIELAQTNGIPAEDLATSAQRSVAEFLALLQPLTPHQPAPVLDQALHKVVDTACKSIAGVKLAKSSKDFAEALHVAQPILARGEPLPWPIWSKLTKKHASGDQHHFVGVKNAALVHPRHPRLHQEAEEYIRLIFDCAAKASSAYQRFKAERGMLDFVDQEVLALEILTRPDTRARVREMIDLVLVDEVQDASPLQIAVFTELARIVPRSAWVGDPKQSIYAFRSTDPNLTLSACQGIAAGTGGTPRVLSVSRRSRPGLCDFVNDLFVSSFELMGLPRESSRFTRSDRSETPFHLPPLSVWHTDGSNASKRAESLAGGIAAVLSHPSEWPVLGADSCLRDLAPGDIAVLCRDNQGVMEVADALSAAGVPVAVGRSNLFHAEEVELAFAALRWTANRDDLLALAEIARLLGGTAAQTGWLAAAAIDDREQKRAALRALIPFAPELEDIRERQLAMTPCEVIDAILLAAGVIDIACQWGSAADRLHRLETFRGTVWSYEQSCARLRAPATLNGLIAWLETQRIPQPKSMSGNAVHVMTYHGAKGLEWPVVILTQLHKKAKARLFEPVVEVDGQTDWRDPLAGRWIRLWPWPYAAQETNVHLDVSAPSSPRGQQALQRAKQEAIRLLYVGATRARDHLVLSVGGLDTTWIDEVTAGTGDTLTLPLQDGDPLQVGPQLHPARVCALAAGSAAQLTSPEPLFLPVVRAKAKWRPLRLQPSAAAADAVFDAIGRIDFGSRIPITGNPQMDVLGQSIHAFLAVDRPDHERNSRIARAQFILDRWAMTHVTAPSLVEAADRLWKELRTRFPGARFRTEVPVSAPMGSQVIVGRIDLLVDAGDGFAIVDHKSYPGASKLQEKKAREHGPQLDLYARAIAAATGKRCTGLFVHMPIAGSIVEVQRQEAMNVMPAAR